MLTIYNGESMYGVVESGKEIIRDVEREFLKIKSIPDTPAIRNIIKHVDQATYIDGRSIRDRFGYKIYKSDLSTGCKAGICTVVYPDKIVDTRECGNNALDAIVAYCNNGNILTYECDDDRVQLTDHVDVAVDGIHFTDLDELNYYVQNSRN